MSDTIPWRNSSEPRPCRAREPIKSSRSKTDSGEVAGREKRALGRRNSLILSCEIGCRPATEIPFVLRSIHPTVAGSHDSNGDADCKCREDDVGSAFTFLKRDAGKVLFLREGSEAICTCAAINPH